MFVLARALECRERFQSHPLAAPALQATARAFDVAIFLTHTVYSVYCVREARTYARFEQAQSENISCRGLVPRVQRHVERNVYTLCLALGGTLIAALTACVFSSTCAQSARPCVYVQVSSREARQKAGRVNEDFWLRMCVCECVRVCTLAWGESSLTVCATDRDWLECRLRCGSSGVVCFKRFPFFFFIASFFSTVFGGRSHCMLRHDFLALAVLTIYLAFFMQVSWSSRPWPSSPFLRSCR